MRIHEALFGCSVIALLIAFGNSLSGAVWGAFFALKLSLIFLLVGIFAWIAKAILTRKGRRG